MACPTRPLESGMCDPGSDSCSRSSFADAGDGLDRPVEPSVQASRGENWNAALRDGPGRQHRARALVHGLLGCVLPNVTASAWDKTLMVSAGGSAPSMCGTKCRGGRVRGIRYVPAMDSHNGAQRATVTVSERGAMRDQRDPTCRY